MAWPIQAEPESPFPGVVFEPLDTSIQTLWLNAELKQIIAENFNYSFPGIRVRYWRTQNSSAWVLDEVGKEQPITIGIAITDGKIDRIEVLEYRESRGGEIQFPFFREQFLGAELSGKKKKTQLNQDIDGITGATLSVNAMKKVAKVALFLHKHALAH
ncbi:FMN-binding domain-containing protein [Alteromonadaceae bacterium Bs31]|nr:FMN-binding domain-containing protein [Alteromonadaceae bacterium Bs31]